MPPLGSSKKLNRDCLVCGSPTRTAHMGVDICRACTIFYRRSSENGKSYVCRTSTSHCAAGTELNCRKCRLLHIKDILQRSGASDQEANSASRKVKEFSQKTLKSCSSAPTEASNSESKHTLLNKVRAAYDKMCFARMTGELNARKEPPAPIRISLKDHPIFPTTYSSSNHANRIFLTCIVELGNSCFPEFAILSNEEKWPMTVKFYFIFRMFDGFSRARERFPDNMNRTLYSATLWLSEDVAEHFFDDCEDALGNVEEAKQIIVSNCRNKVPKLRKIMDRVNPSEEEFLAVLVLMFWTLNGVTASDAIVQASERYREQAFDELQHYYREVIHLENYSSRIGELCMFLPMFETNGSVKQTFEVFRLLGAFPENCFSYQLSKD